MIKPPTRKSQARRDIGQLEIREFLNDLLGRKSVREQIENVNHSDSHAANAGTSAALVGIYGNPVHQLGRLAHDVFG